MRQATADWALASLGAAVFLTALIGSPASRESCDEWSQASARLARLEDRWRLFCAEQERAESELATPGPPLDAEARRLAAPHEADTSEPLAAPRTDESAVSVPPRLDLAKPDDWQELAVNAQRAADASLSASARIDALRELRKLDEQALDLRGVPARDDRVVDSMIELLLASGDDRETREQIVKNLDGVVNRHLGETLVVLLHADPDARVREECAEALAPYASDPLVRQRLHETAEADPSAQVRAQARAALGGG